MKTMNEITTYYFDTNAYWRFYYERHETKGLKRLVSNSSSQILISRLTVLEFIGVLMRYHRKKLVKRKDINSLIKRMRRDIGRDNPHRPFRIIELSNEHLRSAQHILLKNANHSAIQTIDAIHLAVALAVHKVGPQITFVTSDNSLKNVVTLSLLVCVDPDSL